MRRHRLAAFGALAVAACLSACASLFGFEELTFSPDASAPADAPTATATEQPDTAPPIPGICENPKRVPPRPDGGTGDEQTELTFAVDRFDVGIIEPGKVPAPNGFDLDGVCTAAPGQGSCAPPPSQQFEQYVQDKAGAVDNAGFLLLQRLSASLGEDAPFTPFQINAALRRGRFGFLIDVKGYNGEANDANVAVAFRPLLGTTDGGAPRFDGNDAWMLDKDFANVIDFLGSTMLDVTAFVRDGVLYSKFPDLTLPIQRSVNGNVLKIVVRDAVVSARLEKVGGGFALSNGVVAGKWPVVEAFEGIRRVAYGADETDTLCAQPFFDSQVRTVACSALDIQQGVGTDAAAPCDAISVGFGFAASQTKAAVDREFRAYRPVTCPKVDCATPLTQGHIPEDAGIFPPTPVSKRDE